MMPIMHIPIVDYRNMEEMEDEICRLLRCYRGKCAAMHTAAFIGFRMNLLNFISKSPHSTGLKVYMPEGLVLEIVDSGVKFSWVSAYTTDEKSLGCGVSFPYIEST
jgi:hypothetical protein